MNSRILTGLFIGILLVSFASAITNYAEWNYNNGSQSATITEDESISFEIYLITAHPAMTFSVKLYDSKSDVVKTFAEKTVNGNSFSDTYTVSSLEPGNYEVVVLGFKH